MPTYTYQCDSCGHGFEAVQRFADDPLTECPQCGASIRRVIQPVGVVFKGSGWYITDSRPKSSGEGATARRATAAKATDKADTPAKAEQGGEVGCAGEVGKEPGQGRGLADGTRGSRMRRDATLPLDSRAPRLRVRRPLLLSLGACIGAPHLPPSLREVATARRPGAIRTTERSAPCCSPEKFAPFGSVIRPRARPSRRF